MTQPAPGEWYLATDGKWYCWPDPTPHAEPPAAQAAPAPPAPPAGYESPGFASPGAPGYGAPAMPATGGPDHGTGGYGVPSGYVQGYGAAPAPEADTNAAWLTVGGGALLVVGSLLPWVRLETGFGSINPSGTSEGGDGIYTLILGLVAGLVALGAILKWAMPPWTRWVPVAAASVAGLIALVDFADIRDKGAILESEIFDGLSVSVGIGLYVVLVGALVAGIGGVLLGRSAR